jgi:hypothetical protein
MNLYLQWDGEAVSNISNFIVAADTISRRLNNLLSDIEVILKDNINLNSKLSLQIDKSTYISINAQLMVSIRYLGGDKITSDFSLCPKLPEWAIGGEIFSVTEEYLREI